MFIYKCCCFIWIVGSVLLQDEYQHPSGDFAINMDGFHNDESYHQKMMLIEKDVSLLMIFYYDYSAKFNNLFSLLQLAQFCCKMTHRTARMWRLTWTLLIKKDISSNSS